MDCHQIRLPQLSVSCSILIACIVIARPTHRAYAMDLSGFEPESRQGYVTQERESSESPATLNAVLLAENPAS